MDVEWFLLTCPIYGFLNIEISLIVSDKPEPWRSHALKCLNNEYLSITPTYIVIGLTNQDGIVAFAWLSLPDQKLLELRHRRAFIFHVFVKSSYRRRGMGSYAVKQAIKIAQVNGASGILLATDDHQLRENFYTRLGFQQYRQDPYLMVCDFGKINLAVNQLNLTNNSNQLYTMRAVGVHDLATVQSICAQNRWLWTHSNHVIRISEEEVEERFCKMSMKPVRRQYLLRGTYNKLIFITWLYEVGENVQQEILCLNCRETDINDLGKKTVEVASRIVGSHLEKLHTDSSLKELFSF